MSLQVRTKTQNMGYVSTKWWRQQDRTWRHVETYLKTYATKPCNGCQSGLVLMLGDRIIFLIFIHLLVICPCVLFGCIPIVADRKKFLLRLSQIPAPWQHQWESFQSQCHAWSMIDGFELLLDPESWFPVLDCLQVDQYRSHHVYIKVVFVVNFFGMGTCTRGLLCLCLDLERIIGLFQFLLRISFMVRRYAQFYSKNLSWTKGWW